ncbi:MAG: hypothetical protein HN863_01540, partial [Marinovum sp.]|nr:hypothetical protein [Marinovum sp.]
GPAAYVDSFDGPVGTVTSPAMWGQSFTITLSKAVNPATLRVDNTGSGLAIQGKNAQRIDAVAEVIDVTLTGLSSS